MAKKQGESKDKAEPSSKRSTKSPDAGAELKAKKLRKGRDPTEEEAVNAARFEEEKINSQLVKANKVEWQPLLEEEDDLTGFVLARLSPKENIVMILAGKTGWVRLTKGSQSVRLDGSKEVQSLKFVAGSLSEDGSTVAALSSNNIVYVWDATSWASPRLLYAVHTSAQGTSLLKKTRSVYLSPSGRFLVVHESGAPVFIWSKYVVEGPDGRPTFSAKIVATLQGPSRGTTAIECTAVSFGSNERMLALGFQAVGAGELKVLEGCLYDLAPLIANASIATQLSFPVGYLRGHDNKISSLAYSPSGTTVLSSTSDGKGFGWRCDTYKCTMFFLHPSRSAVQHIISVSDGVHAVTAASDGFLRVWGCFPWYARDIRGAMPLLLKLAPPATVCRIGAHMIHLAHDPSTNGLIVVWNCSEKAQSVPEPSTNAPDESYVFVPIDTRSMAEAQKNKQKKIDQWTAALGSVPLKKDLSSTQHTPGRFLALVRYDHIPILIQRFRSDVALILTKITNSLGMPDDEAFRFKKRIFGYLK